MKNIIKNLIKYIFIITALYPHYELIATNQADEYFLMRPTYDLIQNAVKLSDEQIDIVNNQINKTEPERISYLATGYLLVKEEITFDGDEDYVPTGNASLFCKTKKFTLNTRINNPHGMVVAAEEFIFGENAEITHPGLYHFIRVPKIRLDATLTIFSKDS